MKIRKILSLILSMTVLGGLIQTVNASYISANNEQTWKFTDIIEEIGYDAAEFKAGGIYSYNGMTLHGGSAASITEKGLIGNKKGGYVSYTPNESGTLTVIADMNAGAKLFVDGSTSERLNMIMDATENTEKMTASTVLEANKTYYIYNATSNYHKIKSLTYITEGEAMQTPDPTNIPTEDTPSPSPVIPGEVNGQYIHMSFDDTYLCLKDLTENADTYNSIFENEFFAYLKALHEEYRVVFSLYCFNVADGWDITEVTDKFQTEFKENSDWIKFGFHSEDKDSNYGNDDSDGKYGIATGDCPEALSQSYTKFLYGIERLTGNNYESIDHIVRLGFFAGTKTNIKTLQSFGLTGFLGADSSSRLSYYLSEASTLYKNGVVEDTEENLIFLASQSRIESVASSEEKTPGSVNNYLTRIENIKAAKVIEIFTHEGRWTNESVRNMIEHYLGWAVEKGYGFDYAENIYADYAPEKPQPSEMPSEITVNNMYGDNMMLQRGESFTINGRYKNCEDIILTLTNDMTGEIKQTSSALLNEDLTWNAEFEGVDDYSSTYTLTITSAQTNLIIKNILFGDVFLLGGQSNTIRSVGFYNNIGIDYEESEYKQDRPNIRMLDITGGMKISGEAPARSSVPCDEFLISDTINYEIAPEWTEFNADLDYNAVSALAYSIVTKLYERTKVPVGIISTGYDGTGISQWVPGSSQNLYNSRIYPFKVFSLKGILWYQGESDRTMSQPRESYGENFKKLVNHYRELFANKEDVPFYYVAIPRTSGAATDPQNPEIEATANAKLALIRQAQTDVYTELKDTENNFGIVPTLDIYGNKTYNASANGGGENGNNRKGFHTGQKPVIAQRLVNWVLKDLYDSDVNVLGPVYKSAISKNGKLILTYECNGDLKLLKSEDICDSYAEQIFNEHEIDSSQPQEFEIAGEDGVYYRADAKLVLNTVVLSSENVANPIAFRYAYSGRGGDTYVECPNLTDASGIPALVSAGEVVLSENPYGVSMSIEDNIISIDTQEAIPEAILVMAVYNSEGRLENAEILPKIDSIRAGKTDIEIQIKAEDKKEIKFVLWESFEIIKPICACKS